MTMKYDTRSCTITTNWEWVQTGTTPTSTTTTRQEVTTSQRWKYDASYDTWAKDGALQYEGTNFVETVSPPYPSGSAQNGATITTNGKGMADVTTTTGGDPIYGWGTYSTSNNASPSISYDDGTYAGTLTLDSVSGSPSQPSYTGSYIGQTDTTSTSGTAYYSGDVPLKGSGGGTGRPNNWQWTTLSPTANTYTSGKLRVNLVSSGDWTNFCSRINSFRQYKNLATISFSVATSSKDFTQSMYDEAVNAITPMASVNQSGGYYTKMINLRDALNSI